MSLNEWQEVFTQKGLGDCANHVKDADVARWKEGGLSPEDLPDMLDMVLQDADTRQDFATGNMMLGVGIDGGVVGVGIDGGVVGVGADGGLVGVV